MTHQTSGSQLKFLEQPLRTGTGYIVEKPESSDDTNIDARFNGRMGTI